MTIVDSLTLVVDTRLSIVLILEVVLVNKTKEDVSSLKLVNLNLHTVDIILVLFLKPFMLADRAVPIRVLVFNEGSIYRDLISSLIFVKSHICRNYIEIGFPCVLTIDVGLPVDTWEIVKKG